MSSDKFLRGAAILTMAGLMVKVIGSFNRILLSRLLGGEGIGLYQMAYPVYLLILAVSSAGIPIAVSIVISEKLAKNDYYNAQRVFRTALFLMAGVGLVLASLLYFGAGILISNGFISDIRAYYGLLALVPAVFFSTVLACFRGYFQGYQLMTPTAVSQILEQLVRVMTMVVLAYILLPYGLEYAAAGAAFGAVPGGVTGLVVLSFFYLKYKKIYFNFNTHSFKYPICKESIKNIIKKLVLLALPVSCANIMVPISSSIDMFFVPNRLIDIGYSIDEATALFGYLAGMAQPLLMMATIPTMSLAASLVPAVAEAKVLNNNSAVEQKALMAVKICSLITIPAAFGMSFLAYPISILLYGTSEAGEIIMHLGVAAWFLGMHQVTTGILQGIGVINIPMANMLLGIVAKIAALWIFTNEVFGIIGAALATNVNFAVAVILNILVLKKYGICFRWLNIIKIVLAASIMGICAYFIQHMLAVYTLSAVATVTAIISAIPIYIASLFVFGAVTEAECKDLPVMRKFFDKRKKV